MADKPISPAKHAERFMTEFNQNSQLFGQLLIPWVSKIAATLPDILRQNANLTKLHSDVGQMRNKVLYLEGQLNDPLATRVTAEQLTKEAHCAPPPLNLNGGDS